MTRPELPHANSNGNHTAATTILVVDNEPTIRKVAARVLEREGFTVLEAADGLEAVVVADGHRGPIDLLVTEMILQSLNGRLLYKRLTVARSALRALFMSGHGEHDLVRRGLIEAGGKFLEKPFTGSVLVAAVHNALKD